ncbi:SANT/Myb_domain [Hexamita inflata]|uniref:SANT/Myb domain n=1 Tax=Hexamita inflata TaxID=28002 RepID=A0AA86QAN6_9EUKA|nr:SANT/Myb domain [Hexamita inflata]
MTSYSQKSRWTVEEDERLMSLLKQYSNNFREIAKYFSERSYNQVRSHYYNLLNKHEKALKQQNILPNVLAQNALINQINQSEKKINRPGIKNIKLIDESPASVPSMLGTQ